MSKNKPPQKPVFNRPPEPPKAPPPGPPGGGGPPDKPDKPVKIEVTLGQVKITVEGPALEVKAFIEWLRNNQPPSPGDPVISGLKLVFGPESEWMR